MMTNEEYAYDQAKRHNAAAIRISDFTGGLIAPPLESAKVPGFNGMGHEETPLPEGTHITGLGHGYTQTTKTSESGWTTKQTIGW